ncbi:DMT family transporter [Pseudomonadota bacterium]
MSNTQKGIGYALGTALISGVAVFVNKFAVGAITPPLVFTATKNVGVGLLIVGLLLATAKWKKVKELKRDEVLKLGLIGVIGGAVPFYLFFTGLSQIPAINAALIHKSLVFWVALLAIPLLREKLSMWQIGAIGLLYSSNLVVGGFNGFGFSTGELMVLGATMLWAVENVIAKKVLAKVDPDIVTGARMGLGSVILIIAAQVTSPGSLVQVFSLTGTQMFWLVATMATLLGYVMTWYRALKLAPATLVATVLVGATVITNVLSAVFITHKWTGQMGIQAGMIVLGIGIFVWQVRERRQQAKSLV